MSSVPEHQRQLILQMLQKKIAKEDFFRQFPVKPEEAGHLSVEVLRKAIEVHDPDGVEFGLYLTGLFGNTPGLFHLLLALLNADWHMSHEMVVDYLGYFNAPSSAPGLYQVALSRYPYRDYDDADSLGVKAIWALGRLQTEEAVQRLADLATSGRPILEKNAWEQLVRIEERSESEALRAAAAERLDALAKRET